MPKKSDSGISRRDFIKTTGAGALTAGLGPFFLFPERAQVVGEAAVQELQKQLRGELLRPGDGGYDAARRVWNSKGVGNSSLVYSTYLGGKGDDSSEGLALDPTGNVYVTGSTTFSSIPPNFPTTPGAFQTTHGGGVDGFVAKLDLTKAGSAALIYSTYLGGAGDDTARGLAVDPAGNVCVTGNTSSRNFPTLGAFQTTFGGGSFDAFVTKLNAAGSALVYSTYLGGRGDDKGEGIALDSAGNAYVTGTTTSADFPTANPFQASNAGGNDAFVAKLTNLSDLTISVSPPSVTVGRGQSASYTVTVTPKGGAFNDPVSLACSGLPSRTSCSFNPSSVTPGTNPATSALSISTTAGSTLFRAPRGQPGPVPVFWLSLGLAALALFGASLVVKRSRVSKLSYCLSLGIFLAILAVGCGGPKSTSSPSPQPQAGTPSGTYVITITGTSGSLQRSSTATLVVQ